MTIHLYIPAAAVPRRIGALRDELVFLDDAQAGASALLPSREWLGNQ